MRYLTLLFTIGEYNYLMNLFESRDGSVEPGSEYYFKLDSRLIEGIFSKFDPPRHWRRPISLRHISETEIVGVSPDLPRPTRKPGKSRYSSPIPSVLFPDTPTMDEYGREFALVGRRQLAAEQLVAVREKKEDMLHGKAVVLERLDRRVEDRGQLSAAEQDSFAVVVFDAADTFAQLEIEPEVRLKLEEEYRLLPARPQQDIVFQGIVHVSEQTAGQDIAAFEYTPRNFFTNEPIDRTLALRQLREAERYLTEPNISNDYATPFSRLLSSSV